MIIKHLHNLFGISFKEKRLVYEGNDVAPVDEAPAPAADIPKSTEALTTEAFEARKKIVVASLDTMIKTIPETDTAGREKAASVQQSIIDGFDAKKTELSATYKTELATITTAELPSSVLQAIDAYITEKSTDLTSDQKGALTDSITELAKTSPAGDKATEAGKKIGDEIDNGRFGWLKNLLAVFKILQQAMKDGDTDVLDSVMAGFDQGRDPFSVLNDQKKKVSNAMQKATLADALSVYGQTADGMKVIETAKPGPTEAKLSKTVIKIAAEEVIQEKLGDIKVAGINGKTMELKYEEKTYIAKATPKEGGSMDFEIKQGNTIKKFTADANTDKYSALTTAIRDPESNGGFIEIKGAPKLEASTETQTILGTDNVKAINQALIDNKKYEGATITIGAKKEGSETIITLTNKNNGDVLAEEKASNAIKATEAIKNKIAQ